MSSVDFVCKNISRRPRRLAQILLRMGRGEALAFLRILRRLREKNMSFCLKSPVRSACNLFLTEEQKNIRLRAFAPLRETFLLPVMF